MQTIDIGYDIVYNENKIKYKNANTMGEVTHTDKGKGVQKNFYTSLYHTYSRQLICVPFGSEIVCTRFDRG